MSQTKLLLEHLKTHKGITAAEALRMYGVGRLAARVSDLRERGHKIITVDTKSRNRYGRKIHYATYVLVKGDNDDESEM